MIELLPKNLSNSLINTIQVDFKIVSNFQLLLFFVVLGKNIIRNKSIPEKQNIKLAGWAAERICQHDGTNIP